MVAKSFFTVFKIMYDSFKKGISMKVQQINNQNIKGINTDLAGSNFMKRMNSIKRYCIFEILEASQRHNNFDIQILSGKHKTLIGNIVNKQGEVIYTKSENRINGLLNLSPIGFLRGLCKKADKFRASSKETV